MATAVVLVTEGQAHAQHYGHTTTLARGDFLLVDGAAPLACTLDDPGEILVLRVPARVLRNHLPSPDHFCGVALRSHEGISQDVADLVRCVFGQLEGGLSPQFHGPHRAQSARYPGDRIRDGARSRPLPARRCSAAAMRACGCASSATCATPASALRGSRRA
jgi:hypothetical protein